MNAARVPVSFEEEVSPQEQVSRFAFQVSRGGALRESGMEMPPVVAASRLANRPEAATVVSGIEALDALTGGLPRGGLTEICGPASSGRTSVLMAVMAKMTAQGEVCALVDASDSFDPKSAEAAGVELRRVLWVRCSKNRVIGRSGDRVIANRVQSPGDRRQKSCELRVASYERKTGATTVEGRSTMDSLEQALKATDLLLQGGGFGLVVVDLGDVPAQAARRVPLTSWFRFRRAVENTRTVLLVVEQEPYAKTCASVVVKMSAAGSRRSTASGQWPVGSGQEMQEPAHARILSGLEISAEMVRSAAQGKKPVRPAGARWESRTAWAG
jgi:recombination protein RecA